MSRPRVFMDISIDDVPIGRIIIELFNDSAPKTCENFRALCTGEKGLSALSEYLLYYKNSIIHRSIRNFMVQGGDFTKRNGTGGESIYGGPFTDEDLSRPLDSEGLLCMANKGPNTNGSQFFITLRDCPHLNGKHVVFGKVIRGYKEVVEKIAEVPVDEKDRPRVRVVISNCGELQLKSKVLAKDMEESAKETQSRTESPGPSDTDSTVRRRRNRSHDGPSRTSGRNFERYKGGKQKQKHAVSRSPSTDAAHKRIKMGNGDKLEETAEEYDARLEREELLRLAEGKKQQLESIRNRYGNSRENDTGLRFKGRGRMKYVDPEVRHSR